ncbi:MAG: putative metal-binding motif-containing protein [Alphaproteobacteria bacterium]|nr:putative metal-binding motif-containing protein [Alphaproteobacteria bacterium]
MLTLLALGCSWIPESQLQRDLVLATLEIGPPTGDFAACGSTGIEVTGTAEGVPEGPLELVLRVVDGPSAAAMAELVDGEVRWSIPHLPRGPGGIRDVLLIVDGEEVLRTGIDFGPLPLSFEDLDGDGFGTGAGTPTCDGAGALVGGDCDDHDPDRFPGAPERCNLLDDDCDGSRGPDELDEDGDGWPLCIGDSGRVEVDCDDTDASRNPGRPEACGPVDDDCDPSNDDDPRHVLVGSGGRTWATLADVVAQHGSTDDEIRLCGATPWPEDPMVLDGSLTVTGISPDARILGSGVLATGTLSLVGIDLEGATEVVDRGGCLRVAGTLELDDVTVSHCEASVAGGGLWLDPTGQLDVLGPSRFVQNEAPDGSAIGLAAAAELEQLAFAGNIAGPDGAALASDAAIACTDCTFGVIAGSPPSPNTPADVRSGAHLWIAPGTASTTVTCAAEAPCSSP